MKKTSKQLYQDIPLQRVQLKDDSNLLKVLSATEAIDAMNEPKITELKAHGEPKFLTEFRE